MQLEKKKNVYELDINLFIKTKMIEMQSIDKLFIDIFYLIYDLMFITTLTNLLEFK